MILGIDLGTSRAKAGLFDPEGRLRGFGCSESYAADSPRPGWSQADPGTWWRGIVQAVRAASRNAGGGLETVSAVGLSVLFPSFVPLGGDGAALHPAILYNDQRSGAQVRRLLRLIPRGTYEGLIGNVVVPGNCAVSGILWLRDCEPRLYETARILGFTNTFVLSRLTGEFATDTTMASVSGLADIRSPWAWSSELCGKLSIDVRRLPAIRGPADVAGLVSRRASEETGLRANTPVVCGCGDAVASGFGGGFLSEGTAVYTAGSTDCVTLSMGHPAGDGRWVCFGFEPRGSWGAIGTSTSTGAAVEWFRNVLTASAGTGGSRADPYREMIELASSCEAGSGGLIFLPYLQGERTPLWDPDERGMFAGLTPRASPASLARSVFEGTAFALRHVIESVREASRVPISTILAVGGGTKNDLWNRIKADVLQMPLDLLEFQETGTLGAALLAGVGTGSFGSYAEASEAARKANSTRRVEPDPSKRDLYDELFGIYRRVHPKMRGISHSLTRFDARRHCTAPG